MWLFRVVSAIFLIWIGNWVAYGFGHPGIEQALIMFSWIHGIIKIMFCYIEDYNVGVFIAKYVLEVLICLWLCPEIFEIAAVAIALGYFGIIILKLSFVSFVLTGRSFEQTRSALGVAIDRANR